MTQLEQTQMISSAFSQALASLMAAPAATAATAPLTPANAPEYIVKTHEDGTIEVDFPALQGKQSAPRTQIRTVPETVQKIADTTLGPAYMAKTIPFYDEKKGKVVNLGYVVYWKGHDENGKVVDRRMYHYRDTWIRLAEDAAITAAAAKGALKYAK